MVFTRAERFFSSTLTALALGIFWLMHCAALFVQYGYGEGVALLAFGALMLLTIGWVITMARRTGRAGQTDVMDYLNLGVQRYVLGLFMVKYGLPKIYGNFFDYQLFAMDSPMGAASDFELAWYLYGLNPWQELFAGVMEFLPGLLLFHRRTYYLGALLLLPVVAQVFLLNVFFKIGGLTFPIAVVLLLCNLSILWSEKQKILAFVHSLDFTSKITVSKATSRMVLVGRYAVLVLAVLFVFKSTKSEFFRSESRLNYEALVGVYTLESMEKNGEVFVPGKEDPHYKDLYIERQARWNILRRFNGETDAFVWRFTKEANGFELIINKGGTGDRPDILDEETRLAGTYQLDEKRLVMKGIQAGESLELSYVKRSPEPKSWFW